MLQVWAIGKLRSEPLRRLADDYRRRAAGVGLPIKVLELPESTGGTPRNPEALAERLRAVSVAVALDERGEPIASEPWARRLERDLARGGDTVFVVGGAAGLPDQVLRAVDRRLSLSPMTFPHELARVILLEQLYRAATILKGMPYHRG